MTELTVVDTAVEPFDVVEIDAGGRVNYSDGRLVAVHEFDAKTTEYRAALFNYSGDGDTVELPERAVVLDVGGGAITALVPTDAYAVEGR